jgi:hypothetical protein
VSDNGAREYLDEHLTKTQADTEQASETSTESAPLVHPTVARAMLQGEMAGVQRKALVQGMAQHYGNQQVQRMLSTIRRASSGTVGRSASSGPEGGALEEDLADKVQQERDKGQPLSETTRSSIESNLGHDMSQLRVSVNPDLNQAMGAKAFTSGRNVVLRDTADLADMSLLTHEATHAIQQGFSTSRPSSIGAADTEHEKAAEANASSSASGVQRQADEEEIQTKRVDSIQRQGEDEELQMKRDEAVQREGEEEELQMKRDEAVQREGEEEELQMKRDDSIQREGEEEELQMKRDEAVQRQGEEEEVAMKRDETVARHQEEAALT